MKALSLRKSLLFLILSFILVFSVTYHLEKAQADPDLQILEIDGFNSVNEEWTEVGDSPWLDYNDNTNYVYIKTDNAWHEEWTFQDQKVQGTIVDVHLYIVLKCDDLARSDTVEIYLWGESGAKEALGWALAMDLEPTSVSFYQVEIDALSIIGTWTYVNNTKLKIMYDRSGGPGTTFIYVSQAWIVVDYTVGAQPQPPSDPIDLFGAGFNASSPYVELHWNHSLVDVQFFEVQNSSDKISWDYLGQNTTAQYTDFQVFNGTERYYRVRACNFTDGNWYNSSFTDVNFEKVYFTSAGAPPPPVDGVAEPDDTPYIALAIILFLFGLMIGSRVKQ